MGFNDIFTMTAWKWRSDDKQEKEAKWVYLEPNKNFYVSPSNFFNAWILGGGVDCGFKGLEALECELWIILQWFTIAWESQDQK